MPGETGETPPEVVAQQVQPKKESFLTSLTRFTKRFLGRPSQPQVTETQQQPPATGPIQPAGVTPREAVRKLETGQAREMFKPFGQEVTPPSQQVGEKAPGWTRHEAEKIQAAEAPKTPEQLAEEARIDAENLAKMQVPSRPTEELPKVAPFTQPTTLPEKVFQPQPEFPGEYADVDEFLKTKQPTTEAPAQPPETATQAPVGEAIPVQSQPSQEQPIPVNIPQRTPTEVGEEVR